MVKRSETSFFCRGSRGFVFEELCAAGASPRWGHRDKKENTAPWSSGLRRRSFAEAAAGSCSKNFAPQAQAPGGDTGTKKENTAPWSSGLRHRPFTAVTRVRVPVGSPNKLKANPFHRVFQNIEKRRGLRRKLPPRFCGHIPLLPLCRTRHFPDRVHRRRRRRAGRICRGPRKKRRVLVRAGEGAKKAGASVYFCRGVWYSGREISRRRYRRGVRLW